MSWETDLSWSAVVFQELVWPALSQQIHGRVVHVEAISHSDFARDLDQQAGIDAWHILPGVGVRGIASRVQVCDRPYNTFTVRKSRDSGAKTEYQKRLEAIESNKGWLYPALTIQAYVTAKQNGVLLSFGVCQTEALIRYIQAGDVKVRRTSNAEFYVVPFSEIATYIKIGELTR